jgi:elongator complex protein 3
VESSRLGTYFESGAWQPYSEDDLVDLLVADTLATPAYTRISRMIRDISSTDIVAGNKKTNLRQMVEARITAAGADVREIRMREVATSDVVLSDLRLDCVSYRTTVSDERFLQWVTPEGRIAGFLRLSLPATGRQAMIREVHVYGRVAGLGASEHGGAQHAGLGKALVEEACRLASEAGFEAINVISAVGTRNYYRGLGFFDAGLYQRRDLA